MQGLRDTHEDEHCIRVSKDKTLLGVFDGHRGDCAAKLCAERYGDAVDVAEVCGTPLPRAFIYAHVSLDKQLRRDCDVSGTTACSCVIETVHDSTSSTERPDKWNVHVAHAGDARVVLIKNDLVGGRGIQATDDHKPNRPDEVRRIEAAGGSVMELYGVHRAGEGIIFFQMSTQHAQSACGVK